MAGRIETEVAHGLGNAHAVVVGCVESLVLEGSGDAPAAQEGGLEAHALLVDEAHDLDGERQAPSRLT